MVIKSFVRFDRSIFITLNASAAQLFLDSSHSGALGSPAARNAAGLAKNCVNIPMVPISLSIRMMERVAGRSARMAV